MIHIKDNSLTDSDIEKLKKIYINQNWEVFDQTNLTQGSSKNFHLDTASEKTTGTSVTFLNDDFIGGEAVIEGVQIAPIKGRTYYMDGKVYKHAVLNVIKGARFTLTSWYKRG